MAALRKQEYVYGNAVMQPDVAPRRRREPEPLKPKAPSRQVRQNRKKAMHMNAAYVVFLAMAAVIAVVVCINFLHIQSELISRSKKITVLQQELSNAKEENNTKYNMTMNAISLEDVRTRAINELGMVYATQEQIVGYQSQTGDDVKQYESIPESGVIASVR